LWVKKVELKIGNKGRITLPTKLLKALGLREGDVLELDAKGRAIVLKPRAPSVSQTKGVAGKIEVNLDEIEDAIGKED
jgi:AbrB family looped-hinge helix DNA binding protein